MPLEPGTIGRAAAGGLAAIDAEMMQTRDRQLRTVVRKSVGGTGNIDQYFLLDRKFRIVFVRAHFVGGSGMNPMHLSMDSVLGSSYDARLFTIMQAGAGKDVNFRISEGESQEPSPWTLQAGDRFRLEWVNPNPPTMGWGVEVGLALVS